MYLRLVFLSLPPCGGARKPNMPLLPASHPFLPLLAAARWCGREKPWPTAAAGSSPHLARWDQTGPTHSGLGMVQPLAPRRGGSLVLDGVWVQRRCGGPCGGGVRCGLQRLRLPISSRHGWWMMQVAEGSMPPLAAAASVICAVAGC